MDKQKIEDIFEQMDTEIGLFDDYLLETRKFYEDELTVLRDEAKQALKNGDSKEATYALLKLEQAIEQMEQDVGEHPAYILLLDQVNDLREQIRQDAKKPNQKKEENENA